LPHDRLIVGGDEFIDKPSNFSLRLPLAGGEEGAGGGGRGRSSSSVPVSSSPLGYAGRERDGDEAVE
jgi:hypothetical protein